MNMMTKSRLSNNTYKQEQLIELEKLASSKLDELIKVFNLDLKKSKRFYVGKCPIHDGDNKTCFNIFHSGDEIIGNWRCFTHSCHHHFKPTLLGFVRGLISKNKYKWSGLNDIDNECPFKEAVEFLLKFTNNASLKDLRIDYSALEINRFSNYISNIYSRQEPKKTLSIDRDTLISSLELPCRYFMSRGYSETILNKYDIGLCKTKGKEMYMRAVAPIYDNEHKYIIGCTGRSIFEHCPICGSYHNPTNECPENDKRWIYSKWKHNCGFKGEDYLYNYWFAREHIENSGIVILVESPGNVWRLEEAGIKNSVGTFGAHLTDNQRFILDKSGALSLVVLMDPDGAGREATELIKKDCASSYSIYTPSVFGNVDIGEVPVNTIKDKLYPILEKVKKGLNL